jgi:hypothetical protein
MKEEQQYSCKAVLLFVKCFRLSFEEEEFAVSTLTGYTIILGIYAYLMLFVCYQTA